MDLDERALEDICSYYDIVPALVKAIIKTESDFVNYAVRYEPNYKWLYNPQDFYKLNNISLDTETILQKCSFGLMQIMGAVAREYGFKDNLLKLTIPEVGIEYGCKHLKKFITKYNNIPDAISAYNQGSPRKKNGDYENAAYVAKVLKYLKSYS